MFLSQIFNSISPQEENTEMAVVFPVICLGRSSPLHPRTVTITIVPKLFSEIHSTIQSISTPLTLSPVLTSEKNKQSLFHHHVVKGEFLTADPFSKKRSNYSSKYALSHHTWNSIISKTAILKSCRVPKEKHFTSLSIGEVDFYAMCLYYSRSSLAIYNLEWPLILLRITHQRTTHFPLPFYSLQSYNLIPNDFDT